ncbi:MAG: sugar ABC transporter substrate-binding protein [Treponema sp.]|jgi:ribose transport system substrate-binding protein|nr:sugar ABC transporter substrate-binding protein [Treponema sp.]
MKRVVFGCLVLALCAGTVFGAGGQQSAGGKKQYVFGYTCMQLSNPFFTYIEQGMRQEIEKNGDRLITVDPAMDVAKQINQIEDLISQKIDLLFLNPVDWEGIRPALLALQRANIPVVNFDAEVKDMDLVTAYAGSDNYNAGKVCGEDMIKRFPQGGPIAILDSPTMNSVRDRISGFEDAIKGHNFNVVFQRDALGDLPTALRHTEDMLQSNPEVIAIMGGNDPTALGALAACKTANRTNIAIYGVDGSPEAKAAMAERGQFVGSGAQSPLNIGLESLKLGYQILRGESYQKRVPVPTFMINQDNVSQYGTSGWQ